ncbi:hypothetical protein [Dyadobacter psychrophilus]|uniref:Uncharacterized protein n=1 Tax=Dyadobacter psychrophilus TaxID=651661 RepID=A0A1T5DCZ7_9BACT|nr:hypothetical protein [Dyadobacter psychrophilus]SKB69632.1 hypothetical protein SAMN05660293_01539 [Dyadobacter psychrophilus]
MSILLRSDIILQTENFLAKSNPNDRYSSFDYCYNHFKTFDKSNVDIEKSCLVLGFYLASWGMFRGSSFLIQKSVKHFQPLILYIASLEKDIWKIDVDNYSDKNMANIMEVYSKIKELVITDNNTDLTLITKILLGVFGFVPAFDQYFGDTFRQIFTHENCGFRRVNVKSLTCIKQFYEANKIVIDNIASRTFTTDFLTGEKTVVNYPKAKIIDMYGFNLRTSKTPLVNTSL